MTVARHLEENQLWWRAREILHNYKSIATVGKLLQVYSNSLIFYGSKFSVVCPLVTLVGSCLKFESYAKFDFFLVHRDSDTSHDMHWLDLRSIADLISIIFWLVSCWSNQNTEYENTMTCMPSVHIPISIIITYVESCLWPWPSHPSTLVPVVLICVSNIWIYVTSLVRLSWWPGICPTYVTWLL